MTTSLHRAFESMWADLADIGRDPIRGGYSRHLFDDADSALREWFTAAAVGRGLDVETDRNGNVWAWWWPKAGPTGSAAVVTGSHLDSVPGGGAFDGPLGVVSALLAVDRIRAADIELVKPVAIMCSAEEEGGRFGLPCLGSRLLTGDADPDRVRGLRDRDGTDLVSAARRVGFDPSHMGPDPDRLARIGCFVELHIEQGRVMRDADPDAAVGVAGGIIAHGRWRITITGKGNHAGTTAIRDRRDPMVVAAHTVLAARTVAVGSAGAVATVGRIVPNPGGTNVIASSVDLWLDVRRGSVAQTTELVESIVARARQYAANEGCTVAVAQESLSEQVHFDPALERRLFAAADGGPVVDTGAGHDAGILAPHVPSGMLFVRNPTGVSHAPEEHAETDDCVAGIVALADAISDLASPEPEPAP